MVNSYTSYSAVEVEGGRESAPNRIERHCYNLTFRSCFIRGGTTLVLISKQAVSDKLALAYFEEMNSHN